MTNLNPSTSNANSEFTNYNAANGDIVSLRKDDVSFLRLVKNNRNPGYLAIVGMANLSKDQHESFEDYESGLDFIETTVDLIGSEEFVTYEGNNEEIVAIRKDDVSFVRNINDKESANGRVIIIGLTTHQRAQHEFFKSMEEAEKFKAEFLESL